MVLTASDLQGWKDFPKGLRVLLLDEDSCSAAEIQSKLEEMEYIVFAFSNEDEALSAISSRRENFHVAILEVNLNNSNGRFKFLETARELPTIMTSNIDCLTTTMKCIALGAVEFLRKPLSEEKLKNIWQHVVHKAFSSGASSASESLKPIKDSVVSMLQVQTASTDTEKQVLEGQDNEMIMAESEKDWISGNDKFPAPSTPQLKQGGRFMDDMDYQDQTNSSTDKESGEHEGDSKSVETTCGKSTAITEAKVDPPEGSSESVIKEKDHNYSYGSKSLNNLSSKEGSSVPAGGAENLKKEPGPPNSSSGTKAVNRKKLKVDWTPELHKKFVQAVEKLGVDQAIPSRILELMKVEGLTRHNVASHLQKYRLQRRHILPKGDERRWPHPRPSMQKSYYPLHRPVMAFPPPYHTNHTYPAGQVYPIWGQAGCNRPPGLQMWNPPSYPWHPVENWQLKPYPGMHADAWGCPVMPTVQCAPIPVRESPSAFRSADSYGLQKVSADLQPEDEVVDRAVNEAISKPWLPLPIGLKPPSADSVLAELSRRGISAVHDSRRSSCLRSNHTCKANGRQIRR